MFQSTNPSTRKSQPSKRAKHDETRNEKQLLVVRGRVCTPKRDPPRPGRGRDVLGSGARRNLRRLSVGTVHDHRKRGYRAGGRERDHSHGSAPQSVRARTKKESASWRIILANAVLSLCRARKTRLADSFMAVISRGSPVRNTWRYLASSPDSHIKYLQFYFYFYAPLCPSHR